MNKVEIKRKSRGLIYFIVFLSDMYSFIHNGVVGWGAVECGESPPPPRSESARGCMERGVKGKKKSEVDSGCG